MRKAIAVWFVVAACWAGSAVAQDENGPINPPDTVPPVAPMTGGPLPDYAPRTRIRVGGSVMAKSLIHKVDPVYPADAKENAVSGTVLFHVIVAKDGSVQSVEYVSGPDLLEQAAIDAIKKWRYKPTLLNGEPVEVDTTIQIVFTLGNVSSPERQSSSGDDSQPALHDQGVPLSPSLSTDSAPPAAVVPHPKRIRVSSDVAARGLAHVVEPAYSPDVGTTGTVVLHAIISREGEVTQLELVSGQPVLAQWAIDAARQWRYKPLKINGEPIQVDTTINVVFALDKHGHLKKQPRD